MPMNLSDQGSMLENNLLSSIIIGVDLISGLFCLVITSPDHMLLLLFIPIFYTVTSKLMLRHGGRSK